MIGWLAHIFGIDTQNSHWYDFWSGVGAQLTLFLAVLGAYHKHNCHVRFCPRIGKHIYDGTPYCTRHHPAHDR